MTNTSLKVFTAVLGVLVLAVVGLYFRDSNNLGAAGIGPNHYQAENFLQGLYGGTGGQFVVSNVGALTSSGANALSGATTLSGTNTLSGATTITGTATVLQTTSSTLNVGGADNTGCIVLGDSSAPTSTNKVYITASAGTVSATTTKPVICK